MRSQQKGELRLLAITRSQKITTSTTEPVVSFFGRRRQFLLVRIDNEHGQQFRGVGLARVLTSGVAIEMPSKPLFMNDRLHREFEPRHAPLDFLYYSIPGSDPRKIAPTEPLRVSLAPERLAPADVWSEMSGPIAA
jgi:hypothetical protein